MRITVVFACVEIVHSKSGTIALSTVYHISTLECLMVCIYAANYFLELNYLSLLLHRPLM